MTLVSMLLVAAALAAGSALAWLLRERECVLLRSGLAEEKSRAGELVVQLSRSEAGLAESRAALAAACERVATLQQVDEHMRGQFAVLAQGALEGASRTFLELATARLGGAIGPVKDEFAKFSAAVTELQNHSAQDLGSLRASLAQVVQMQTTLQDAVRMTNDATGQLRNALQNPRIAGNWGEFGLRRIVELAGMTDYCDFDEQKGMRASDGTLEKPDLTIHLTGGLNIPVDAKTSVLNYINAVGASDETERARLLRQSALDIRSRVAELRARAYDRIDGYAGMTLMYVHNESMLSSALAQEPNMIEEALAQKIVICSPLLLLCYLRAFAHGWSMQKQQENAKEVARRGKMLFERLQSFFTALGKVGWYLNHTVEKFNSAVGKMDNLLVPGRELGKMLGVTGDLGGVDHVGTIARDVRFTEVEGSATPALAASNGSSLG